MASKTFDVDLRIRAQNLSKSTVRDIADDVERLTKAQEEQARASSLAARSMKELTAESSFLNRAMRELQRREGATKAFLDQQQAIKETSEELARLTAQFRALKQQPVGEESLRNLRALEQQIVDTNARLEKLVVTNEKARKTLSTLGVDADKAAESFTEISTAARKSEKAYEGSVQAINRYSSAVAESNKIQAEAARRNADYTAQVERNREALRQAAQATQVRPELQSLRADIEARSAQARAVEVQTEAMRRLNAEQARQRAPVGGDAVASDRRARELAELRKDIQERSALTAKEDALLAQSNARRERLVALLNTERGQRILAAEAHRRETQETDRNTKAKASNAAATQRASSALGIFDDTGRKSLSTYQRLRGQLLSITATYVGLFQAISTFQSAIAATNRNQALQIGLNWVNAGDIRGAASDYEFLRKEADRLGLVFDDLAPKFVGMAVSGKAVGLTGKQIREVFTDVATSVAASNLSIDDSEGVFRAIVQIMGKARVQAEELRGQLGDRLPGAVAAFAKANNIAITELDDLLKKGRVGIPQLLKFLSQYADESATDIDKVTNRLQAYINRATNAYNDFLRSLLSNGNDRKLSDAFKRIEEFLKGRQGQEFAATLASGIGSLIDIFIALADNIDKVTAAIKAFIALQVAKFLFDTFTQARNLLGVMANLTTAVIGYGNASAAAALKTDAFGKSAGLLSRLLGPIAALLAGITAALYSQGTALDNAAGRLKSYTDTLHDATFAKNIEQIDTAWKGVQNEIGKTDEELKILRKTMAQIESINPLDKLKLGASVIGGDANDVGIGLLSRRDDVEKKINQALARQQNLRQTLTDLVRKQTIAAEQQEDVEVAVNATLGTTEEEKKKKEGRSAEDIARQQAAAQRALNREVFAMQDEIAKRQQENGIKTDAQAQKNHDLQMRRNEIEFEDQLEKIEQLKDAVAKANQEAAERGLPQVDVSEALTALEGLAQRRQAVSDQRADETLELDKILIREKAINDLISERDAKLQAIRTAQEVGLTGPLDAMRAATQVQDEYNARIRTLTDEFLRLLAAINPESNLAARLGLDELIAKFQQVNVEAAKLNGAQKFLVKFGEQIASGVADAFVTLGKGLASAIEGTNSFSDAVKGAWDAFRNFAADFLQQIARMIIQQIILNALQQAASNAGGRWGRILGVVASAATGHTGGKVGQQRVHGNATKMVNPAMFAGAQRFHGGGVVPGLGPREVPIVAEMGEEIITQNDPRHIDNGGMSSGMAQEINIIATLDPANVVAQGIPGARNAFLVDMARNPTKYKRALNL